VPDLASSACRLGIYLYGGRVGAGVPEPETVASVRCRVIHVRDAPAGTTCGYGATYTASKHEKWATLPLGYGDGTWCRGDLHSFLGGGSKTLSGYGSSHQVAVY